MIKYWTFMILSFYVDGKKLEYPLMFPSYDSCSYAKAKIRDTFQPFATHQDVHVYCKGTDVASNELVKPMPRPDTLYQ